MVLIRKESNYPLQRLCQNKNFNSCYGMTEEICKARQAGDDHVCNIKYIICAPYLVIFFHSKRRKSSSMSKSFSLQISKCPPLPD